MPTPNPSDEARHPHTDEELWNESYYFDWFDDAAGLGGYVRIGFYPNLGVVWYWACLVGPDRKLISIVDHEVPLPAGDSLDLAHEGLWASMHIPTPLERVTVDLEAFGLILDDPTDMYARPPVGEVVPFGFELDFETDRAAYLWPPITDRYEIPCAVTGRVQVGDEVYEISGWGQRDHSWGSPRDWWSMSWCWTAGRLEDGTRFHTAGGFFPGSDWGVGYELSADAAPGGEFSEFDEIAVATTIDDTKEGREGLPSSANLKFGDLDLTLTPVAFSPVLLVSPDDREARFPRALATVTAADGRTGTGWIEWNQPPATDA